MEVLRRREETLALPPVAAAKPSGPSFRLTGRKLFSLVVVLPVALATFYYGVLATDRFLSESRFLVRGAEPVEIGGLASLMRTFGLGEVQDHGFAVESYMRSRDALADLAAVLPMDEILDRPEADLLSGCMKPWARGGFETLYGCYRDRVRILREQETGITRLSVDLFRPEDSHAVAAKLLQLGEDFANRLNERAETDALAGSEAIFRQAEGRVVEAQEALTVFRDRELMLDADETAGRAGRVIEELSAELARTRTALDRQRQLAPESPAGGSLRSKAAALERRISEEEARLAGGEGALSGRMGAYEELVLQRELAGDALKLASAALDEARREARRQSLYVETIVAPNLPDRAIRPQRARMIATVALVSLALFGMAWLMVTGAREHADRA